MAGYKIDIGRLPRALDNLSKTLEVRSEAPDTEEGVRDYIRDACMALEESLVKKVEEDREEAIDRVFSQFEEMFDPLDSIQKGEVLSLIRATYGD